MAGPELGREVRGGLGGRQVSLGDAGPDRRGGLREPEVLGEVCGFLAGMGNAALDRRQDGNALL